ncbi:MAG: metalloregulator ArsR/SmtB family transcription factor [Pseudohongiellaceae bacterium]
MNTATRILSSLSQDTRLRVFRLLIEFGASGAPAGRLSEELEVPHNTLSFHLSHLSHAGLVHSRKEGRSVIYTADPGAMDQLIAYLRENCCVREEREGEACSLDEDRSPADSSTVNQRKESNTA